MNPRNLRNPREIYRTVLLRYYFARRLTLLNLGCARCEKYSTDERSKRKAKFTYAMPGKEEENFS